MYKIKNISNEDRKLREHHTGKMHFIKSGQELRLSHKPITQRTDVFEITEENKKEEPKKEDTETKTKTTSSKSRSKSTKSTQNSKINNKEE